MGNNKSTFSRLKRSLSNSAKKRETKLENPEPQDSKDSKDSNDPKDPNDPNEERKLTYYLARSNDNDDIDRRHATHFFKRYIFQSSFSAPVEERLIQGCKVLDVG